VYVLCNDIVAVTGLLNPPTLDMASAEILLSAGDNVTVRCFGDLPLNWTYPVNEVTARLPAVCVDCRQLIQLLYSDRDSHFI